MQTSLSQGAPEVADDAKVQARQYLTFSLGRDLFAVGILVIKEIIQYGQLTTVPLMPAFIRGVINLRGAVVPVIDLALRFGGAAARVGKRSCIVVLEITHDGESHDIGMLVDAVSAVVDIPLAEIEAVPDFGTEVRSEFIEGMGKIDGHFVIILDVARTFSLTELASIDVMAA
ncbi:chemotaxis protein CheW [Actimicrobium sp. CCI2.3]|uniref:chemotaxis protein CheW n=1 Tax=Actimicrobium sp. CCI2.3 TaxID=3048616 RepID=UPI002AB37099|nr:chemotaxis protein CheW [Actimicrobium sp. CCI2.3]MDY7575522.1 chemotaxis protein CheW [Actimicrobium sp. CCI2.3]MEB0022785.1 chemotaxis protein CheW [Actimicrobium sp. CCI2.3]